MTVSFLSALYRNRNGRGRKSDAVYVIAFFLSASLFLCANAQLASAYDTAPFFIAVESPQNRIYNSNASIPLVFTVNKPTDWMGYSLNGEPNVTVTGNITIAKPPDGLYNLVVFANDTASGETQASPAVKFSVDTVAPTGSIKINDGASSTIDPSVALTLSAQDATSGVVQMRFFDLSWNDWEAYTTFRQWSFSIGTGYKTVYVQFKDNAGLISSPYRATIFLGNNYPQDSNVENKPIQQQETDEEPKQQLATPLPTVKPTSTPSGPLINEQSPTPTQSKSAPFEPTFIMAAVFGLLILAVSAVVVVYSMKHR